MRATQLTVRAKNVEVKSGASERGKKCERRRNLARRSC
jgi:hypothetical protein